jgi:hypothetical protein
VAPSGGQSYRFIDEQTNTEFDLSILKSSSNIQAFYRDHTYYVNVLGNVANVTGCESASFCRQSRNNLTDVWRYKFHKLVLEGGDLKLVYSPEDASCGPTDYALLFLHCDKMAAVNNKPVVQHESGCVIHMGWSTPLVCDVIIPATCGSGKRCSTPLTRLTSVQPAATDVVTTALVNNSPTVDVASHHSVVIAVGIILVVIALLLSSLGIIAIVRFPNRRHAIGGHFQSCFSKIPAGYSLLGRDGERARESDSLLQGSIPLTGNIQHYDSDDDLIL